MAQVTPRDLALVSLGGVIGALARFGTDSLIDSPADAFPWSTFLVNALGCLAIGVLAARGRAGSAFHRLAGPGILGGFTTMSAYAEHTRALVDGGHGATALAYVAATLVVGALAVAAGRRVAR